MASSAHTNAPPGSMNPSISSSNVGQDQDQRPQHQAPPPRGQKTKGNIVCKFYKSTGGCRSGDSCPFLHPSEAVPEPHTIEKNALGLDMSARKSPSGATSKASHPPVPEYGGVRRHNPSQPPSANIVAKPIPQAQVEDPRAYQLGQVRRRYSPIEAERESGTNLSIKLVPSDPDFPFDIQALECVLYVPDLYPKSKPTLRVNNKEMGRGYQINVEKGFDDIVQRMTQGTLLQYLKTLDKELEILLATPKAETITLVANINPDRVIEYQKSKLPDGKTPEASKPAKPLEPPKLPQARVFAAQEIESARLKRETDTRQLEARLGRLPLFAKSSDGLLYTVPIEPRKRTELPQSLRSVKSVKLIVPEKYNLEPCRIEVPGVSGDAVVALQESFQAWARDNSAISLVAQINHLSQHMHDFAAATSRLVVRTKPPGPSNVALSENEPAAVKNPRDKSKALVGDVDDRSHIITIPRPPEWVMVDGDEDPESDDSFAYDSGDETDEEAAAVEQKSEPSGPERGILISFPYLELHGIELLELSSLCITVKCDRCKDQLDVQKLKNNETGDHSGMKSVPCKKCSNQLGIGYRMDLMHANSVRAGYLDMDACTVVDMLPSNFIPTCAECSTPYQAPGVVSVRGESTSTVCRECHKQMSFRIPEIKFLRVSAATVRASRAPPRKKKEILGIVAGQELPSRGKCKHYSKSYRWFRFSCCNKVFPCDKCHDAESDHPTEHANRMICGWCSREQNYRPEDCGVCHASLIAKRGTGFWEGGKGTRDKTRMSRKDPRKYKRRPGTKVGS